MTSVGKALLRNLNKFDIGHVFGYSGGAALPLLNQLYGNKLVKFIDTSHEQWAGHAAEGYAKSLNRNRPGVVIATSGPGVTNLVTPLQDAYNDFVPLVAITGQVNSHAVGTRAFQEVDAVALSRPCTVWSHQLSLEDPIDSVIDRAFNDAVKHQRPVLIDVPKDVAGVDATQQQANFEPGAVTRAGSNPRDTLTRGTAGDVYRLLSKARRPVLLLGQGAINPQYQTECTALIRQLIDLLELPHCTTLMAAGYCDERHPLNLKMLGMHGSFGANWTVHHSDLIVGIGCRFDDRIIGKADQFATAARDAFVRGCGGLVAVNRGQDIGLTVQPDLLVQSDSYEFLKALVDMIVANGSMTPVTCRNWRKLVTNQHLVNPFRVPDRGGNLNIPNVLTQMKPFINDVKPIVSTGVGCHQMMACQFLIHTSPGHFLTSGSLGTMGVGVPFAVGAAFANPEKTVLVIDGDGSFNMSYSELNTVRRYNLPVKIVIMNDARQQMVYMWQELFFDRRIIATENDNPDYLNLAQAHGVRAFRAATLEELNAILPEFFSEPGPALLDARVTPEYCLPFVAPGKSLIDMITSNPLKASATLDRGEVPS